MKKIWIILSVSLLLIDQIVKQILIVHPNIFGFSVSIIKNDRFILGYGPTFDFIFWVMIFLILLLSIWVIDKPPRQNFAFLIMLSGAASNLIDRVFRGGVIDYLKIADLRCNLADIYLLIGLIYYLYLLGKENEKNQNKVSRHK